MLKARAISEVARDACEEALFGLHYTPEELGAEVNEDGTVTGEIVNEPTAPSTYDPEWVNGMLERASAEFASKADGEKLWVETAAKHREGGCTNDERRQIEALITARIEDIAKEDTAQDGDVVEGVIVDGLDPEDPWATTVESIVDAADAAMARADLEATVKAGKLTGERTSQIRAAIDAKAAAFTEAVPV